MYKKYTSLCKNRFCIPIKLLIIMKLSFVLLITAGLQIAAASSYAQKISIIKQNISLQNLLKDLEKQTGYNFIYNSAMLDTANPVSLNLKNASLKDVLDQSFSNQPLNYTINGNTVVILKKEQPKQPVSIKGKVVDKDQIPMPGVSVKIKNTNIQEVTNVDGEYTIRVPDNKAILR